MTFRHSGPLKAYCRLTRSKLRGQLGARVSFDDKSLSLTMWEGPTLCWETNSNLCLTVRNGRSRRCGLQWTSMTRARMLDLCAPVLMRHRICRAVYLLRRLRLRRYPALRIHRSLFHSENRQKEVNLALFQFKSFLIQPCVIILMFNWLEGPLETLAGQQ
jgi:hypothetical protein